VGICRSVQCGAPTKSTTTTTACDPGLLAQAEREFATADTFINAGTKDLGQAADSITDFEKSYFSEAAEIGTEKITLLKVLEDISETAAEAAEITGIYVGAGVTAEQLAFDVYPLIKDTRQLSQEAQDEFDQGLQWAQRAEADLKRALAQGPCIGPDEKELDALLRDQKIDDEARSLIDSWQNNGAFYVDPVSNDVLDEAAAMKQAKAQLAATASSDLRSDGIVVLATAGAGPSKTQLQKALAYILRAMADQKDGTTKIALLQKATTTALADLDRLF